MREKRYIVISETKERELYTKLDDNRDLQTFSSKEKAEEYIKKRSESGYYLRSRIFLYD